MQGTGLTRPHVRETVDQKVAPELILRAVLVQPTDVAIEGSPRFAKEASAWPRSQGLRVVVANMFQPFGEEWARGCR